jgi:superfamily II DNA/RNA helicase
MTTTALRFDEIIPRLSDTTLSVLSDSFGFARMTPVQATSIPLFLKNKDVCVEATTGSGKTIAFVVPIFEILLRNESSLHSGDVGAMVIAPTRELAAQIFEVMEKFSSVYSQFQVQLMVGGSDINAAVRAIEQTHSGKKHSNNNVVGTPGRILDIRNRLAGTDLLPYNKLEVLVLDEADTLLDMGFKDAINSIISFLPKQRRTGLFSATQTKDLKELARAGMRNPVTVSLKVQQSQSSSQKQKQESKPSNSIAVPTTLTNYYCTATYDERPELLRQFINAHLHDKIIVFCATCACVDYFSSVFNKLVKDASSDLLPSGYSVSCTESFMFVNGRLFVECIWVLTCVGDWIPRSHGAQEAKRSVQEVCDAGLLLSCTGKRYGRSLWRRDVLDGCGGPRRGHSRRGLDCAAHRSQGPRLLHPQNWAHGQVSVIVWLSR